MVKEDIYKLDRVLDRDIERRILEIFPDDQGDVRRFINYFLAQGYSSGRIIKYLHTLVSIRKRLDKPFKKASIDDIKRFVGGCKKAIMPNGLNMISSLSSRNTCIGLAGKT